MNQDIDLTKGIKILYFFKAYKNPYFLIKKILFPFYRIYQNEDILYQALFFGKLYYRHKIE